MIIDSRTLEKQISNERKPEKVVDKKKDLDSVNNELFCLLDSIFFKVEQNSSSATIFYSHFIKKCKDKGLFSKLIEHIVDVAHSNHGVKNMRDLFEHVMDLDFKEGETRRYFLDLWRETIEELESEVAALILFQMKLNAERRFQNIREYFTREYEEMHFQNRNDYERIVVEGDCIKCNFQTVIALPYLDYRKRFSLVTRDDTIKLDCPKCGAKDSLVIPNF